MPLTPLDILQKQFLPARKAGLDPDDVQRFLDEVRAAWEATLAENQRLREELRSRESRITELRSSEDEIKETLMLARKITLEMESSSRREADLIVGEARLEAERVLAAAYEEERAVQEQILRIKSNRLHLLAQFRATLEAQSRFLDTIERSE